MSRATVPASRRGGFRQVFTILGVFAALLLGGATAVACDPGAVPPAPAASLTAAPTSGAAATTAAPVTTVPAVAPVPVTSAAVAPPVATVPETTAQAAPVNPPAAGDSCGGDYYVNSDGACVHRPVSAPTAPAGATAKCNDGTYSFSKHRSGTCSGHGGVAEWL